MTWYIGYVAVVERMTSTFSPIQSVCHSLENLCNDALIAAKIELFLQISLYSYLDIVHPRTKIPEGMTWGG